MRIVEEFHNISANRTCKSFSSVSLLSSSIFMSLTCTFNSRALLLSKSFVELFVSSISSWSFDFVAPDGFLDWDRINFDELFSKPCADVKEESESVDRELELIKVCESFAFDDVPSLDLQKNCDELEKIVKGIISWSWFY